MNFLTALCFCNHEATLLLGGHLRNANVPPHCAVSQMLQLLAFYSRWQTDKEMCVGGGRERQKQKYNEDLGR